MKSSNYHFIINTHIYIYIFFFLASEKIHESSPKPSVEEWTKKRKYLFIKQSKFLCGYLKFYSIYSYNINNFMFL